MFYILDEDRKPVPCDNPKVYRDWRDANWDNHRVARTVGINNPGRFVSTVFLGIDHNHAPGGEPILWESMAFDGSRSEQMQDRYTSEEEARIGHRRMVEAFFAGDPTEEE